MRTVGLPKLLVYELYTHFVLVGPIKMRGGGFKAFDLYREVARPECIVIIHFCKIKIKAKISMERRYYKICILDWTVDTPILNTWLHPWGCQWGKWWPWSYGGGGRWSSVDSAIGKLHAAWRPGSKWNPSSLWGMYSHHACGVRALISSDADCCSRILNLNITRGKTSRTIVCTQIIRFGQSKSETFLKIIFFR